MSLLRALAHLVATDRGAPAGRPPARERRRRGWCAYHADLYGDRLEGYDGARRVAWVERLERTAAP